LLALVLLVVLGQPVLAQGGRGGEVVIGRDFALHAGERLDGDLVVFGGNVILEPGSSIRGDVLALGGSIQVAGLVEGDTFAFGGDVRLGESAVVLGDAVASGSVVREPGAVVNGQVMSSFRRGLLPLGRAWRGPFHLCLPGWEFGRPWGVDAGHLFGQALETVLGTLAIVVLGVLVVLLIPGPTRMVSEALVHYPAQSIGIGLLTGLVAILALPLLIITCIGIPAALLAGLALAFAVLFGWVTAGLAVGERLLLALNQRERQPLVAVAAGLLVLAFLSALPCLGFLVSLLVGAWGLGAAVLTRFGTMPYVAAPPATTPDESLPEPAVPPQPGPPEEPAAAPQPLDPPSEGPGGPS